MKKLIPIALAVILASQALAQEGRIGLGVGGGAYFPTNSKTKRLLGNTWLSFSISPTKLSYEKGWKVDTDLDIVTRDKNGNRLFMGFLTFGVSGELGNNENRNNPIKPYAAVRVGPAYLDYRITDGGTTFRKKRLGWNGNVELGANFNDNVRAFLRYDTVSKFDGFNFDGFSANVVFKIGRL